MKIKLGDHPNVYITCIEILNQQGWKIELIPILYENEYGNKNGVYTQIVAKRNEIEIYAEDPLRLLGLATIDQYHQPHNGEPYWWSIKSDLLEQLEDEALDKSFLEYKIRKPNAWKEVIINAIEEYKKKPKTRIEEIIGISLKLYEQILNENPELKKMHNTMQKQ